MVCSTISNKHLLAVDSGVLASVHPACSSDVPACAFALSHACLLVCLYAALCPATFKLFVGSGFRALSVWCICLCLLSIHGSVLHPPCNLTVRPLGAALKVAQDFCNTLCANGNFHFF